MPSFLTRIRFWIQHRQLDADLSEEIDFHRASQQASLSSLACRPRRRHSRRVVRSATSRWRARMHAGCGSRHGSTAFDRTRHTLADVRRAPAFAASMVLVTALGISATTAVFGLVDGLVLAGLPVREPERLVWFSTPSFSYPVFSAVGARSAGFLSGFFAWNLERRHVQWQEALEPVDVLAASGDFYSALGVKAAAGGRSASKTTRLAAGRAAQWLSSATVLATALRPRSLRHRQDQCTYDNVAFTVIGVTPPGFFGVAPGLAPEITIPLTTLQTSDSLTSTSSSWLHLMGRLRDGMTLKAGNTVLQGIWPAVLESTAPASMPQQRRAVYLGRTTALEPGRAGFSRVRNQFQEPLWVLLGLGGLLSAAASAERGEPASGAGADAPP